MLTAFIIASLVLLQPDNSQTTVQLLSLVAIQNGGAPSRVQAFLNETAEMLPESTNFQIPTAVSTINTLWFLSLVLSLAAALFGILAKQWCREYLRWHSVTTPPRENVLVRQLRYEAWQEWHVPSFIAAVPALLEVALIFFLVGLFLFVPMYSDRTFTGVISTANGSTLAGFVVLTILPTIYRRCPFQSPTSWACVRLAPFVRIAYAFLAGCALEISRAFADTLCRVGAPQTHPWLAMDLVCTSLASRPSRDASAASRTVRGSATSSPGAQPLSGQVRGKEARRVRLWCSRGPRQF